MIDIALATLTVVGTIIGVVVFFFIILYLLAAIGVILDEFN